MAVARNPERDLKHDEVEVTAMKRIMKRKKLKFAYTMDEFLRAIREGREPRRRPVVVVIDVDEEKDDFRLVGVSDLDQGE